MHLFAYRFGVVVSVIGIALMARGMGMGSAPLLWSGVSLAGLCLVLFLFIRRRGAVSPSCDKPETPVSSGQCPDS